MKIKIWGIFPITRNQFIIIETIFFVFFLFMTVFFFSYKFPAYVSDPLVLFHAKYLKYASLIATFLVVIEAQFYLNGFISRQKDIIELQNEELIQQKDEILTQQEELRAQRDHAQQQNKIISAQKKHITESINYAGQIQAALLPKSDEILNDFEHFVLYKPKEIVSGDFYWVFKHKQRTIVSVVDCTGHGVPGALLSVLGLTYLNEIISYAQENIKADEILNKLREKIIQIFKNDDKNKQRTDGMDIALYILDENKTNLQFAGAYNSLYIVKKKNENNNTLAEPLKKFRVYENDNAYLINVSGDPMPVGISRIDADFTYQDIKLQKNDTLYVFSDGYVDQFGGKYGKKFMTANFRKLLMNIQDKSMPEQMNFLNETIEQWRTQNPELKLSQLDDITILGLKV